MDDDLVEVWILLLEYFKLHQLVLKNGFLLDAAILPLILFVFLLHELSDAVLQTRLALDLANLLQHAHDKVFGNVLRLLNLSMVLVWKLLLQIIRHDHDVVKRDT